MKSFLKLSSDQKWLRAQTVTPLIAALIVAGSAYWAKNAPLAQIDSLPESSATDALLEVRAAEAPLAEVEKLPDTPRTQEILNKKVAKAPQKELVKLPATPAVKVALKQTNRMRRPYGMTPSMFNAYIVACEKAKVAPQKILQTIGRARASAGSHAKDGVATEGGQKYDYTTSVDVRSREIPSDAKRRLLLSFLTDGGYAPFYRKEPQFPGNRHFHIVWAGLPMKRMTRAQVVDFVNGRNGLVGHARETFWQPTPKQAQYIRAKYLQSNAAALRKQSLFDFQFGDPIRSDH